MFKFYSWFKFPFVFGYGNRKNKGKKIEQRIKLNHKSSPMVYQGATHQTGVV